MSSLTSSEGEPVFYGDADYITNTQERGCLRTLGMRPSSSVSDEFICLVTTVNAVLSLRGDGCLSQIKIDPVDE